MGWYGRGSRPVTVRRRDPSIHIGPDTSDRIPVVRRSIRVFVVAFVVFQLTAGGGVALADSESQSTRQGLAVEVGAGREADLLDRQDEFAPAGVADRDHAFVLYGRDGGQFVVYTDRQPADGRASVTGRVVATTDREFDVIFADTHVTETRGRSVSLDAIRTNRSAYGPALVRVNGTYRQVAFERDTSGGTRQETVGLITAGQAPWEALNQSPGRVARSVARSSTDVGGPARRLSAEDGLRVRDTRERHWWLGANATVDLVVAPGANGTRLRIAAVERSGRQLDSPAVVQRSGEQLRGEVVTTTGALSAESASAGALLAADGDCQPAANDSTVTRCQGAADVRVFAGVLADENGTGERAVPVVGLSNGGHAVQRRLLAGRYRLTGRVVAADQVDPTLPWEHAIVTYTLEPLQSSEPVGIPLRNRRQTVFETMRTQLVTDDANWSNRVGPGSGNASERELAVAPTATPGPAIRSGPVGSATGRWAGIRVVVLGGAVLVSGLAATIGRTVSAWVSRDLSPSRALESAAWVVGLTVVATGAIIGTSRVVRIALVFAGLVVALGSIAVAVRLFPE